MERILPDGGILFEFKGLKFKGSCIVEYILLGGKDPEEKILLDMKSSWDGMDPL